MNGGGKDRKHRLFVLCSADDYRKIGVHVLTKGIIDGRPLLLIETGIFEILHYPDDLLDRIRFQIGVAESFADWIFTGKVLAHKGLVDDRHFWPIRIVCVAKL